MQWGEASWSPKGRGWGEKVFPVMRDRMGIGHGKTIQDGDENPILHPTPPHPIVIPKFPHTFIIFILIVIIIK